MPSAQIQFRATPMLAEALPARAGADQSLAHVAQDSLERYFTLLAGELRRVRLSREQALLLCDVLNGTLIDPVWAESAPELLAAEVEDSDLDGMGEKWDVDLEEFVTTIRSWSRGQALAVVDAVGRWWKLDASDWDEALIQVGLLRRSPL